MKIIIRLLIVLVIPGILAKTTIIRIVSLQLIVFSTITIIVTMYYLNYIIYRPYTMYTILYSSLYYSIIYY